MTHAVFMNPDNLVELPKRAFPDGCGHRESEYIGTVVCGAYSTHTTPADVYVHEGDIGINQAHVCIRYGKEGYEYVSAGSVMDFLAATAANGDWHPEVAALILKKLDFFCERKHEDTRH